MEQILKYLPLIGLGWAAIRYLYKSIDAFLDERTEHERRLVKVENQQTECLTRSLDFRDRINAHDTKIAVLEDRDSHRKK